MIHLVLDTNILHEEGLTSGRMQILKKLTDSKYVKIHIPDLVKREFVTKRISQIEDYLGECIKGINNSDKKLETSDVIKSDLKFIKDSVSEIVKNIPSAISDEFKKWEEEYRVSILRFDEEKMHEVLNDYFSGSGVFKKLKHREDIPDSIINTTIESLIDEVGDITVLIKDGTFKKHLIKSKNITIYDSLTEFFKTEAVEELTSKVESIENMKTYLMSSEYAESLVSHFSDDGKIIEDIHVPDGAVENTNLIGIRIYHAEITMPNHKLISDLTIDSVYDLSDTKFIGDISFITEAPVSYVSDYGSYLQIDSTRDVEMYSMNGDGMCDLIEVFKVKFHGQIEIEFNSTDQMRNDLKNINLMNIFLEVEDGEILQIGT